MYVYWSFMHPHCSLYVAEYSGYDPCNNTDTTQSLLALVRCNVALISLDKHWPFLLAEIDTIGLHTPVCVFFLCDNSSPVNCYTILLASVKKAELSFSYIEYYYRSTTVYY